MATLQMVIDASKARQGAAEFNQATASMKQSASQASQTIEQKFDGAWKKILQFTGAVGGFYALRRGILSIAEATAQQERAQRDLAAAIGETDTAQSITLKNLESYAAGLQRITVWDDDLIISQMAYAKNLGVTTDKLEEASEAAIGLAARYRMDLSSAMELIGRASQGQTSQLARYGIVLDDSLSKEEKFGKLLQIGASSMSLAKAQTQDAAGAMQQLTNSWSDLKEVIGTEFSPAVAGAFRSMTALLTENDAAIKRYISDFKEGMDIVKNVLPSYLGYKIYKGITGGEEESVPKGPRITDQAAWERFQALQKTQAVQQVVQAPPDQVKLTAEEMKNVVDRTRDAMESVRHQGYLTRMERIESLKIYRDENAATLAKVEEANRALDNEIRSLERSRLDAMKTYHAELREDFEDLSLYQSEKAAEVARSIEDSMGNAFHGMISEGASFRDAMSQFFLDVGSSFSRMASDMLARAVMLQVMNAIMPGSGSALGFASGVSGTATPGAGRFALGGVFDRGRVVPFADGGIFPGPTYFPLAGGKVGLAGEAGDEAAVPLKRMRTGRLGVETSGPPVVTVQPRVVVRTIIVKNEREAELEAMRSEEGQTVIINTVHRAGGL